MEILPEMVGAEVLNYLIECAKTDCQDLYHEQDLQNPYVCISVPARFKEHQTAATIAAGKLAGIK